MPIPEKVDLKSGIALDFDVFYVMSLLEIVSSMRFWYTT